MIQSENADAMCLICWNNENVQMVAVDDTGHLSLGTKAS